ncbi:MAG: ABC transporter permease, partial [Pseudomonadales bacterium]
MITNLSLSIGFRYIRSKRNNSYISFVSLISFVAMSLGVMVLVVVLSVMNGFEHEIKKRILNVLPHISVTNSSGIINWGPVGEKLLKFDHIEGYAPFVEGYGLLSSSSLSQGVLLQGISPPDEVNASSINDHMIAGEINDLEPGQYGMLIGSMLAGSLGVTVGDKVVLSLPELNVTPVGVFPRYKRFYIRGIYQVGAQVDGGMAFIHYVDAQ